MITIARTRQEDSLARRTRRKSRHLRRHDFRAGTRVPALSLC